jgi:hypothetical protein
MIRTTFEFRVFGSSRDEVQDKIKVEVAKFLQISQDEVADKVDIEMKAGILENSYFADVHVRIK